MLAEAIVRYDHLLHGPASRRVSQAKRDKIMAAICHKVNALGVERRTPNDIRKRWNDMKRRTREKLARARAHARGTGGGAAREAGLTSAEREVAKVLSQEQVVGLHGIDTAQDDPGRSMHTHSGGYGGQALCWCCGRCTVA